MELFKNLNFLFYGFGIFLFVLFIYFQLILRRDKIIYSVFSEESFSYLVGENLYKIRKLKDILFLSSLFFMVLSLAGPQWQLEFNQNTSFSGNIVIAIDTSLSMSASDLKPNRLENSKLMLKYIFKNLPDYKFSIIAFQAKPYVQCPMTSDTEALQYFTDKLYPNMLPNPGTNIPLSIKASTQYLSSYQGEKLLVLITDGENHYPNQLKEALDLAKKENLKIITVGIGTNQGDLIKIKDQEYKKDLQGHMVLSKLGEKELIEIANFTGGKYIKYSNPQIAAEEIKKFADSMKLYKSVGKNNKTYKNHYQIPLFIVFLLIMIEFIIMEGKTYSFKNLFKFLTLFLIFTFKTFSFSQSPTNLAANGNSFYKKGDYSKAYDYYLKAYEKKPNDKILFNLGNSLYKLEQYDEALKAFTSIKNPKLKEKAIYNAGNTSFMKKDNENAIKFYKEALMLNTKDKNAQRNLEIALIKKNNKNNKNNKDNKDNKDNKNDKNNENKNQEKNKNENKEQQQKNEKQTPEQKRAEQILNMLKEKENENQKKLQKKNAKPQMNNYEEKDW